MFKTELQSTYLRTGWSVEVRYKPALASYYSQMILTVTQTQVYSSNTLLYKTTTQDRLIQK